MNYWPCLSFLLFVAICQTCFGETPVEETTTHQLNNISSILEKAEKDGEKMILPVNKHQVEGLKAAKQATATFHSPAFQKRVKVEQQRLANEVFKIYTNPWQNESSRLIQEPAPLLSEKEKIYLFLSSSVPVEAINAYLATIASVGTKNFIPVMFGLVNGMADKKAGTNFFSKIFKEDLSCRDQMHPQQLCRRFKLNIRINPTLFNKYGISQVPALVYETEHDAFVIEGDAGLTYLLELINREAKSPGLATFIKTIQATN